MSRYIVLLFLLCSSPLISRAASLSFSPTFGTFTVGSTFDVSVVLDSGVETVNAASVSLYFPPDKLQLVSSSAGQSAIGVWVMAPQVNNQSGQVSLEGVIPTGLKTNNALLITLTFQVKAAGQAALRFASESRVLAHDGVGTDVLRRFQNSIYQLGLPPPSGPLVISETHPDQSQWYANTSLLLSWISSEDMQGYSYVLDDHPMTIPDDISEGTHHSVSYQELGSGQHYFHIKALRGGVWGETTHFSILVDTESSALSPTETTPEAQISTQATGRLSDLELVIRNLALVEILWIGLWVLLGLLIIFSLVYLISRYRSDRSRRFPPESHSLDQ